MTDQATTRLAEIRARRDALPTYVKRPWSSEYDSSGAEINFDPCHKVYDADADLVFVTDAGREVAALLQNAPDDLEFLLSLVEQLQGQVDKIGRIIEPRDSDWKPLSERYPEYFKPVSAEERARRNGWDEGVSLMSQRIKAVLDSEGVSGDR